jgi:hypothetical protein
LKPLRNSGAPVVETGEFDAGKKTRRRRKRNAGKIWNCGILENNNDV